MLIVTCVECHICAKCRYAEYRYAECRYSEYRYAEGRGTKIASTLYPTKSHLT
jgi:hypothetical protein